MRARSLYFGGGTPSLWSPGSIRRVIEEITQHGSSAEGIEVTLECNPCTVDPDAIRALREAGVTRLSVGVQSVDDSRLKLLGRVHNAERAWLTLQDARSAGFERINADLMFGLPGESAEQAVADARSLAQARPEHISAYLLSVATGTPLHRAIARGALREPDEDVVAASYLEVSDALTALGYEHYEVSNFAQPGCRSEHNQWVWRGGDYIGLGAGATGCARLKDGRVVRATNTEQLTRYMEAVGRAQPDEAWRQSGLVASAEELDPETLMAERIMLGLRLAEGLDVEGAGRELGVQGWTLRRERQAAVLEGLGRVERSGSRVRIPRRAWLWESDTIARLM